MSDEVTGLYPPNPVVTVTTGGVPGRPGVVTPPLSEIHADTIVARDDAQTAAGEAVLSASSAATARSGAEAAAATATQKAAAAASSATAAATSATAAQSARDTTLAAAILELRGTGQPGSTTATNDAPVGTYYTDAAGTAGAWRWLKTSAGSGVAQWKVVYGDTGWRDVSSLLSGGWSGTLWIRRIGPTVHLYAKGLLPGAAWSVYALPQAFRPPDEAPIFGTLGQGIARYVSMAGAANTHVQLDYRSSPETTRNINAAWLTENPWPITLPGTPA